MGWKSMPLGMKIIVVFYTFDGITSLNSLHTRYLRPDLFLGMWVPPPASTFTRLCSFAVLMLILISLYHRSGFKRVLALQGFRFVNFLTAAVTTFMTPLSKISELSSHPMSAAGRELAERSPGLVVGIMAVPLGFGLLVTGGIWLYFFGHKEYFLEAAGGGAAPDAAVPALPAALAPDGATDEASGLKARFWRIAWLVGGPLIVGGSWTMFVPFLTHAALKPRAAVQAGFALMALGVVVLGSAGSWLRSKVPPSSRATERQSLQALWFSIALFTLGFALPLVAAFSSGLLGASTAAQSKEIFPPARQPGVLTPPGAGLETMSPPPGGPAPAGAGAPPVALLLPGRGAMLPNGSVDGGKTFAWEFRWSEVPRAERYHLYVIGPRRAAPAIDNPNLTQASFRGEARNHIDAASTLGWRWKVRAMVGGVWGPFSDERAFDVEPPQGSEAPPRPPQAERRAPAPQAGPAREEAAAHVRAGLQLADGRRFDAAVEEYDKAISLDPRAADAYFHKARALLDRPRPSLALKKLDNEEAFRDLDQALAIDPGHLQALRFRGFVHNMFGRVPEAVADVQRACSLGLKTACPDAQLFLKDRRTP
ncbi:MAG: tetratricopeptide repeat protein [Elusimicrobia bacterium]|nr:tetratricopeptide repeat protein [Elusimicrobiota bacterium]